MNIYALILSAVIIAAGIALAVSCITIYRSGAESPFTREIIGTHLKKTAPFTVTALLMTVGGGIMSLVFDIKEKRSLGGASEKRTFLILKSKLTAYTPSEKYTEADKNELGAVKRLWLIFAAACILISTPALIYILSFGRYTKDNYNTEVAYSAVAAFGAMILSAAAYFVISVFMKRVTLRRIALLKEELTAAKAEGRISGDGGALAKNEGHTKDIARLAIIALAVVLIIIGISNGGMADVLGKAVQICTECIGLG
ncbi:MAG: hypothetical protein IKD45_05075 [Clostridia bacterium]|nr:hypothetical protein [Clostridia bacterium]